MQAIPLFILKLKGKRLLYSVVQTAEKEKDDDDDEVVVAVVMVVVVVVLLVMILLPLSITT